MDDTTKLASELLNKLAELDAKVNSYRQDMAHEYRRYERELLQHLPQHVSARVEKVVAGELQNYPAIKPALDPALPPAPRDDDGSHPNLTDDRKTSNRKGSPPPVLPHTSGTPPDEGARPRTGNTSEHEPEHERGREREFHGLFTPSFLPLLEAVQKNRNLASPVPIAPSPASPSPSPSPSQPSPNLPANRESNHKQDPTTPPPAVSLSVLPRPASVRRQTEETVSSNTSEDSASHLRRSALRRSSSPSIKTASPRRVRFDVEGQEVLPTASPPLSPRVTELASNPLSGPTGSANDSMDTVLRSEGEGLLGSSPPRPKKITSTDRLKAMTRSSTEDTSKWTVVGSPHPAEDDEDEDELVMPGLKGRTRSKDAVPSATAHIVSDVNQPTQSGPTLEAVPELDREDTPSEDDESGDNLEMPALSSFKGKKRFSPPKHQASAIPTRTSQSRDQSGTEALTAEITKSSNSHSDDEDMFEFEDSSEALTNEKANKPKVASKYIEEEEEYENLTTPRAGNTAENDPPSLYSTSPAVPIAKAPPPPPAAAASKHMATSVGSYKGRPFSISSIKDPKLHKKAAEMGDFNSFVGSVDGRSGVDESSSYRPEPASFSGTPRSLSERLMKEELEAAIKNTRTNKQGGGI
ncbi:hypothetical protein F4780DRAFT_768528 [Xylariomycetidae sp. FL0641]|nr:hypothetical protein F4780DRAFT_768528 [Xylariomycetidae sp. FL0641]